MNSKKTTVNLSARALEKIGKRTSNNPMSHVIDRDLQRFYFLIEEEQQNLPMKPAEIKKLSQSLSKALNGARINNLSVLRPVIEEICEREQIEKDTTQKIRAMSTLSFIALLDLLNLKV